MLSKQDKNMKSIKKNEFEKIDLIDQKINKNFLNYVKEGDLNKVKKALENGADINSINSEGVNALSIAIENVDIEMIGYLIEKKIRLFKHGEKDFREIAKEKFEKSKNTYEKIREILYKKELEFRGEVRKGKYLKVKKIIEESGIDINENCGLPIAIYNQDKKMIKILLEKGANINHIYKEGINELMLRVKCKDLDKVKKLIEFGANIKVKDEKERDLMYYAAISKSKRMINYIEKILYEESTS
jgi:ankyrin repeat protein